MLRAIREFLDRMVAPGTSLPERETVELATAVLLVEVMRADAEIGAGERAAALRQLGAAFQLAPADVQDLLAVAEERSRQANDLFGFTSVLNERLTQPQKIAVVEQMWRIAFADAGADPGESHIISKVAGLLHVTHGDYIAAKLHAQQDIGSPSTAPPGQTAP
jgi:uncharacterized tellurite resistance protein B-like protein